MGADPLIGLKLGDYVIEDQLAAGGMGLVYRARHPLLKRVVAVKVLRQRYAADAAQVQRFVKEAQLLSALRHQGIVDVFNFGDLPDGRQFMMMELLAGETLDDLLRREGKLPPALALKMVDQMLDALSAAHRAGVVHRDLKPSNIFLVEQSGGGTRLKLLDFGIAKQLGPNEAFDPKKKASLVAGTPQYISPEQAAGLAATPRSDLYAVGGILFQMLSGRPPFVGDELGYLLRAHATVPAPSLKSVAPEAPAELDALVAQLLAKKPEQRPQSADAVRNIVVRMLEALPRAELPVPSAPARTRTLVLGFGALMAVGMLGSFVALELASEPPPAPVAVATPLPKPPPKPAPVAPPAPEPPPAAPAMDEAAYKAAMAAAIEKEKQMAAGHRDRELVMGVKALTEQGVMHGHEAEQAEQILAPALASQVATDATVKKRGTAGAPEEGSADERVAVLRQSCARPEWKRSAGAKLDRELAARLTVLSEDGLPSAAAQMKRLRTDADRLNRAIGKAKTVDQCLDVLTDLDRWVAKNVAQ